MITQYKSLNNSPGIYLIKNVRNGLVYIGSSKLVRKRVRQHVKELNNGTHYNKRLQGDWGVFGGAGFVFGLLFECPVDILAEKEMEAFRAYGLPNKTKGYNCDDTYPYHPGKRHTDAIRARMKELRASNPQWAKAAAEAAYKQRLETQKPVVLISPDGLRKESVVLKAEFARDVIGCPAKSLYAVTGGKIDHIKGWAMEGCPRTEIFDPQGVKHSFVSYRAFRKWVNEPKLEINDLLKGNLKSSRKWALKPEFVGGFKWVKKPRNPITPKKPIVLLKIETGLTNEYPSRADAAKALVVDKADIYALLRGTRKTIKGWRVADPK